MTASTTLHFFLFQHQQLFAVMAPAPAVEAQFKKDEKALCFHHELMYEAKIIEVSSKEEAEKKNGYQYKVHYKGWKNT